ncbi:DinB family protein [Marinobacter sp. LV10R510-11A]|uniref:DinB family protein n=1 Tax=Marinobacter sp. LV10R510-11A TaxID=1415568 RepID=UPI000BB96950|nr:DinB family protein [Marinobacter sp. LV10R510-11A]SOB77178.1 DinB family protein [Marinobacter sp. LV10R510-11A]
MKQPVSDNNRALGQIVDENVHAIGQLVQLLDQMPGTLYRQCFGARNQHVIGKHVRHIIDHYSALLTATSGVGGLLDYENRNRDLSLEKDRRAARDCLEETVGALRSRFEGPCADELNMRHNSAGKHQTVKTSVERELVFLASHTIHHMAIIGMLAEQAGVKVSSDFGVHPSTLRYLEGQAADLARSA